MATIWDFSSQEPAGAEEVEEAERILRWGAIYSPEVTFPQKCPSRLLSQSVPKVL